MSEDLTIDEVRKPLGRMPSIPKGCEEWNESDHNYKILRIHWSADPAKTQVWADAQKKKSPSENTYRREFEIDHYAGSGSVMYPEYSRTIHVCKPFPIPHTWTRYMGIDPHKRRPHAFLWMAVDQLGDHWYYREYWPSRVYGKKGDTPEDDKLYTVDEYVAAIKWLEGSEMKYFAPGGFADNQHATEKIRLRVQDTHGKAIFTTTVMGKDEPETFWDRYQKLGIRCKEAVKDIGSGRDTVGKRLHPRKVMYPDGEREEAIIHIFDTLPELNHEMRTGRFPSLTPSQAERMDPTEKELQKRKHMLDCIAEGTLILTRKGEIPIEDVSVGDSVLTRQGWKRVTDAWCVGERAVLSVSLSNGQQLTGTGEHLVWTEESGWKCLQELTSCDTLKSWQKSYSTAESISTAPTEGRTESTFAAASKERASTPPCISIEKYGSFITALSRKAITSIIKRMLHPIPRMYEGSNASRRRNTFTVMPVWSALSERGKTLRKLFDPKHRNGIVPKKEESGIRRSVEMLGRFAYRVSCAASSVGNLFARGSLGRLAFAPMPARLPAARNLTWTTRSETVPFAVHDSASIATRQHAPVPESVQVVSSPKLNGTARVFDLSVEGAHEFYASGVLVHNCIRYIEMEDPQFIPQTSTWSVQPMEKGISY